MLIKRFLVMFLVNYCCCQHLAAFSRTGASFKFPNSNQSAASKTFLFWFYDEHPVIDCSTHSAEENNFHPYNLAPRLISFLFFWYSNPKVHFLLEIEKNKLLWNQTSFNASELLLRATIHEYYFYITHNISLLVRCACEVRRKYFSV